MCKVKCKYCDRKINTRGLTLHLKTHGVSFLEYVKNNLSDFHEYHMCPICNLTVTKGTCCSIKCISEWKRQTYRGRRGWSAGLTKNDHPGLSRMAEKASRRIGRNVWAEMDKETKLAAKRKLSIAAHRRNQEYGNVMYGKSHSLETKKRMRLSAISYIESCHGQIIPRYNKSSISIIEKKAKELGIHDLKHAENGGEYYIDQLGYWVDGYSPEKNIVIEYDESYHFDENGKLRKRDIIRQKEIENVLGCKFIRMTSKTEKEK